ncbi:hypothetical protein [Magnetospirillum molischianum]|uniref:Transposase n=1 Tax=Magnetospirillum molischianum DSM 120 TaxID=1150626 RepID=H8FYA5_MAGML|nr:hypothetical protein [Magnetospirillum molischianum]CCG43343.1 hypothetical protein PHAMO_80134 [Magnetospirillum molischianum DSM 120]
MNLSDLVIQIQLTYRQRKQLQMAQNRIVLQLKALARAAVDGDKDRAGVIVDRLIANKVQKAEDVEIAVGLSQNYGALFAAHDGIASDCAKLGKELEKLAKKLPVAEWVATQRGVGMTNLANIIGEAGDLANYNNPAKLWKRMGLAVIGTERQRKVADAEAALVHGYNPVRRSVMWNVGTCIIKAGGALKTLYDERKVYEAGKSPDITKMLAHRRAQRYVEKRVLRDLWRAWRGEFATA